MEVARDRNGSKGPQRNGGTEEVAAMVAAEDEKHDGGLSQSKSHHTDDTDTQRHRDTERDTHTHVQRGRE